MQSGIVAINKPEGISSAQTVAKIKKHLKCKKAGHTGTLDPFAQGLLLCAVNKGTRISQFFLKGEKKYTARICLGKETDTYDLTGSTVFEASKEIMSGLTCDQVEKAVRSFKGQQEQIPPAYSALKHQGQPLYKLARQGKQVKKQGRQIEIYDIQVQNIDLPFVDIEVLCSAGTYIRSIAYDLGKMLDCGGHLVRLARTQSGRFKIEKACSLSDFEALDKDEAEKKIVPMSECLDFLPFIRVEDEMALKVRVGRKLTADETGNPPEKPGRPVRIIDTADRLLAVASLDRKSRMYNYTCVLAD